MAPMRSWRVVAWWTAALVAAAAAAVDLDEPRYRVHVNVGGAEGDAWIAKYTDDYRRLHDRDDAVAEAFLSEAGLARATQDGKNVTVLETAQPLRTKLGRVPSTAPVLYALPEGYSTLDEINAYLAGVAEAYPTLARVLDSREFPPGVTFEGRRLPLLKLTGNVSDQFADKPTILINALHHAREIVTPHLTLDALNRLTSGYATDPVIRAIVDSNVLVFAPVWNSDGYEYVWNVNNMWRKNRKPSNDGAAYGIDQNRNYAVGWDGDCPGSSVPSSDTYRGPSPASEEETQTMEALSQYFNLAKMIDFHSSGREVVYGFQCEPIPAFLNNYVIQEGEALAAYADYAARPPAADGQHQVWTLAKVTVYSFLVETETEFQPSFERAQQEAERTLPLSGHVTNAAGSGVGAEIRVTTLTDLFVYQSDPTFGRYSLFLPDGQFTLQVSAPGYNNKTVSASVANASPSLLDIVLD